MIGCKHKWSVLSETVTKSKFEHAMEFSGDAAEVKIPCQMCCAERKYIQLVQCDKCGKLKRYVENI